MLGRIVASVVASVEGVSAISDRRWSSSNAHDKSSCTQSVKESSAGFSHVDVVAGSIAME